MRGRAAIITYARRGVRPSHLGIDTESAFDGQSRSSGTNAHPQLVYACVVFVFMAGVYGYVMCGIQ